MRPRTIWIVAGGAAVVVAVTALVWFLAPRGSTAEDQAIAYFRALADGDLEAVQATGVEVSEEAASAFPAASGRISEVALESSTAQESSTLVTVSYVLGEERFETELAMIDDAGSWVPDTESALGAVQFNVPVGIDDVTASSETRLTSEAAVSLLPAEYEVAAIPSAFLDAGTSVQILPGSAQEIELEVALRPESTEVAQAQLDEYLTICTEPAAEVPASCGFVVPWASDFSSVSEISYRIEQSPSISLTLTSFYAVGGELVATVTGAALDGSSTALTYQTKNWSLRGDVTFTADDIMLSAW